MIQLDLLRRGAGIAQSVQRLGCGVVDRGSISDKGISPPKHPDQFCVPSSFVFNGSWGKAAGT
jgi:hypothetical protein